ERPKVYQEKRSLSPGFLTFSRRCAILKKESWEGCIMVKQVWMSRKTQRKSRYGLHMLGGIFGIAALALVVTGGGTVLGLSMGWPVELFSPVLCAGVTVLMLVLSVGLGRRSVEDTTVFFLTEED